MMETDFRIAHSMEQMGGEDDMYFVGKGGVAVRGALVCNRQFFWSDRFLACMHASCAGRLVRDMHVSVTDRFFSLG